jgi:exodeoxyribonuclease VII large subunit
MLPIMGAMEQGELVFTEERRIYSVTEIVGEIRSELESSLRDVSLQGEISNFRQPSSGHLYFTLKDSQSQIAAVCFRLRARYLKFRPEDGMDIVARGTVTVYPPRGQLQFMVESMEPLGTGALQLAFEQLKKRLQQEGLFETARKKDLPLVPTKIGVVTSQTGAAIRDMLRVLERRSDRTSILLYPSRVQGEGAASEIAEGIRYLEQETDVDLIVLARGGGSLEDLWAFNEEVVARAIFDSQIPVISAVGHEIDFTISDFVADVRAATPTAAAEIVSDRRSHFLSQIDDLVRHAQQLIRLRLQSKRNKFIELSQSRTFVDAESRVRFLLQRLDELYGRLCGTVPRFFESSAQELSQVRNEILRLIDYYLKSRKHLLDASVQQLKAFSPLQVLERGYAIVSKKEGQIVRAPDQVERGEEFGVRVAGGEFRARKE